jgi:VIT1/CCC1 family predicted Fe2+/Mn2+ transporter
MADTKAGDKALGDMLAAQRNEIAEHHIYAALARMTRDPKNKKTLERISREEHGHYEFWKGHTHKETKPDMLKVWMYTLLARIFGITFAIKRMESGEKTAQARYATITNAKAVKKDEEAHERALIGIIDEERLRYVSSMVLGLNDALVELSGALAGLTFALQNAQLIATTGLITGIAASLSMASSEYLSTQTEEDKNKGTHSRKSPIKAAAYTGLIYIITVVFLILPYMLLNNLYLSLAAMLATVVAIIFVFTFYISVVNETPFLKGFFKTAGISLGIAAISFGIGLAVRALWGIQV